MNRMAVLFVATALFAAPAVAGTYSAKPISVPASAKIIGKDISWTCTADGCRYAPADATTAATVDAVAVLYARRTVAIAELIHSTQDWPVLVPVDFVFIAVVFSAVVGIFFGFYPARKASALDPIEALRFE